MPNMVKKQVAPKTTLRVPARPKAVTGSVWDRVEDVSDEPGGLHLSTYGRAKTGKTRLIATFPKPVLIATTEKGDKSILGVKDVKVVRLREPEEVVELAEGAMQRGFRTFGLDQASGFQDMILARILGLKELPEQKFWGMAAREQYGQCSLQFKTLLKRVLDLQLLHVVITAHERNFKDEGDSDLIAPTVGSALSPAAAGWLNGAVDYICQTFIREKSQRVETFQGVGPKRRKVVITRKVPGAEYCLRVGPHPVYMTGFRLPPGFTLPELIVDPNYEKIAAIIRGSHKG